MRGLAPADVSGVVETKTSPQIYTSTSTPRAGGRTDLPDAPGGRDAGTVGHSSDTQADKDSRERDDFTTPFNALNALYYETDGSTWKTKWDTTTVEVIGSLTKLDSLNPYDSDISGTLPSTGPLGDPEFIDLRYNSHDTDKKDPVTFMIEVVSELTLSAIPDTFFYTGDTVDWTLDEIGGPTDTYSLTPDLPAGLGFDGPTRKISGTPSVWSAVTDYTLTATDGHSIETAKETFKIRVYRALAFDGGDIPDTTFYTGHKATLVLPTEGNTGATPWDYSLTPALPAGLVRELSLVHNAIVITGTPRGPNSEADYTWEITDGNGRKVSELFKLTIKTGLSFAGTVEDQRYRQNKPITTLTLPEASGGEPGYTYKLSPAAPTGLTFSAAERTLSGTPTGVMEEPTTYTYSVEDTRKNTLSLEFDIVVIEELTLAAITEEVFYTHYPKRVVLPAATGGSSPQTYSLTTPQEGLPPGLAYDGATRAISGAATQTRSAQEYTWQVEDGDDYTASQTFTIEVREGLALDAIAEQIYYVDVAASVELPEATGGESPYVYMLTPTALPSGLDFDASTRTLSGTPEEVTASATFTYKATDGAGNEKEQTFTIEVLDQLAFAEDIQSQKYRQNVAIDPLTLPSATGGRAPFVYALSPTEPTGLDFDASTRQLTGTPTQAMSATTYTYSVEDALDVTRSQTFSIEVIGALALSAPTNQVYSVDVEIADLTLPAATGGEGPYTYTLTPALPPGLRFNASTRTLSGTPTQARAPQEYTYEVTDGGGFAASQTFTIEVKAGLALSAIANQVYTVGTATSVTLPAAAGGLAPYSYSLTPTTLPPALRFDASTRTVSGTPTQARAPREYTFEVTDNAGTKASQTFTIEVRTGLALSTIANQVYYVGTATSVALPAAVGGATPYTYALTPASPPGLRFDASTRTLSGTPTQARAPQEYTYEVTDGGGLTASRTFTIEVRAGLALSAIPDQIYYVGAAVSLDLPAAAGGATPYTYALTPTTLPPGIGFDASTRTLGGTPTQARAPQEYTYEVTDGGGLTASQTFTIEVIDGLALAAVASQVYEYDVSIGSVPLPPAVGGAAPYQYALSPALPPGLAFDAATHTLSGVPEQAMRPTLYAYSATDSRDSVTAQSFDMEVLMAMEVIPDRILVVGEPVAIGLPEAHGGVGEIAYTLSPQALPTGLRFDATTRTISGAPTQDADWAEYTVLALDAEQARVERTFRMRVVSALTLASIPDQLYYFGVEIEPLTLPEAVAGAGSYAYALTPAQWPQGLDYDASTRMLTGTPTEVTRRTYTFTVTDLAGARAEQTFTIEVREDLALEALDDLQFAYGASIGEVVLPAAVGGTAPYRYRLSPAPPRGLTFEPASHALGGTPQQGIPRTRYAYSVTDSVGLVRSRTFHIEVLLGLADIADQAYVIDSTITPLLLPAAAGDAGAVTYTLDPDPPPGLTFDASARTLSGAPTEVLATTSYTYKATDTAGARGMQTFSIVVRSMLTMASIADQVYVVDDAITPLVLPEAMRGVEPYTYSLLPDPPSGLRFDATTRTLSGAPTAAMETARYTYRVQDAQRDTVSQRFNISVRAALSLAAIPDQVYAVGEAVEPLVLPEATGGVGNKTYMLTPEELPPGLAYDARSRTVSGTPTEVVKQSRYTYTATDSLGAAVSESFGITVAANAALIRDREALIALYHATRGPEWTLSTNWLKPPASVLTFTPEDLDAWHGVEVSGGRVSEVLLPENNLRGALPDELRYLTALTRFRLQENGLTGKIPSALGQLARLRELLLHDNALGGTIPAELGELSRLEKLHVHHNELTGEIPAELGSMVALRQLWLHGNALHGAIPLELGRLDSLRGLLLNDNALAGPIPAALGALSRLEDLWLQENQLTGAIPGALGQLDSLQGLLLNDNALTGPIPAALGVLSRLEDVWLQENQLTGAIPPALGQLGSLQGLLLHDNALTGPIPASFGNLGRLRWLQLQNNALAESIPPALGRLAQLERLELSGNRLTGPVPDSLGNLAGLQYLYVDANALSGSLPASLARLSSLKELFFDGPAQEVCAPADAVFGGWLASLRAVRGPTCGVSLAFAAPMADQRFVVGQTAEWTLPAAADGTAPYRYSLYPELPPGLRFDAAARTLRGLPRDTVSATMYTYTVADGEGRMGRRTFSITVTPGLAEEFSLHGNYPNPFHGTTRLELSLARDARVSVEVFDLLGRKVLRQQARLMSAGAHRQLPLDTMDMTPGLYLYRVEVVVDGQTVVHTGRMIRL